MQPFSASRLLLDNLLRYGSYVVDGCVNLQGFVWILCTVARCTTACDCRKARVAVENAFHYSFPHSIWWRRDQETSRYAAVVQFGHGG